MRNGKKNEKEGRQDNTHTTTRTTSHTINMTAELPPKCNFCTLEVPIVQNNPIVTRKDIAAT